ncbi:MAG: carbamoyl transferase [Deltaproteobacteria bacterium]|nr:carbamoyl transferase [Deltaproteobacteria bacterium]
MKILGINFSNDAAAALLVDGRRVAASTEERFTRRKHDASFPASAIGFCLKHAGLGMRDLDAVGFFWNPGAHLEPGLGRLTGSTRHHAEYLFNVPGNLLQLMGQPEVTGVTQVLHLAGGLDLPIHYVDHHTAHAASALFNAPFDDCAILTADGYGERTSTMVASGEGRRITPLLRVEFPHSIGGLYAAVTQYLGFKPNSGEGKVMGLSSYGEGRLYEPMRRLVNLTDEGFELDLSYFSFNMERTRRYTRRFVELFGPERAPEGPLDERHHEIARALQMVTEDLLLHMAGLARARTGKRNLVLNGGVALNCVANTRIVREAGFERCVFYAAASDAGSSLGAAQYVSHVLHGEPRDPSPYSEYLGFGASTAQVDDAIQRAAAEAQVVPDPEGLAARLLTEGAIVGWYQGRSELGPRALGNRSILADPRRPEMKDILNARVKFREPFRPFAPSCIEEACGELFDSAEPSPYMLRVYDTLPAHLEDLRSITHVDGGARVQTVTEEQNGPYYRLIRAFGRLTGVPCVLNTSFNIRGEPIVNTPDDALRCYLGTDMDYLFLHDRLVAKRGKPFPA